MRVATNDIPMHTSYNVSVLSSTDISQALRSELVTYEKYIEVQNNDW